MKNLLDIKGLGQATKLKLEKSSIYSIEDLLLCFPKSYKTQELSSIHSVKLNQAVSLEVLIIKKPTLSFFRKNLTKLSFQVVVEGYEFTVDIYNRHYLTNVLNKGEIIVITGKFKESYKVFSANDIVLRKNYVQGIIPEYKIQDIKDGSLKKIIANVLAYDYRLIENLPKALLERRNLGSINQVIRYIHQPANQIELNKALERLKYQELIYFALRIAVIKNYQKKSKVSKKTYDIKKVRDFIESIDFELTKGQKDATNDIFRDLKSDYQMNRLLQGDVGSGKTIVALLAALATVTSNSQVALMAPTLVLAQQHFDVFNTYLSPLGIQIALLTSEIPIKEKRFILEEIVNKKIDIVIGTHALIQDRIQFKDLALVVIDEQHRFGVSQRKIIREKGYRPDILMMSATPIPRSLAISIFESADISQINEKPKGRKVIKTKIIEYSQMRKVFNLVRLEVENKHQVFVICPLIEESETSLNFSVQETYKIFSESFPEFKIDILHGKMSDKEKLFVLDKYKNKITQILISTTVIEVGVDIENATTMVIMNANTFGLAQLHQLRGRIGRNAFQSYCCLIVNDGIDDLDRLKILEETNDGFKISEFDLKIRGPGEVFGKNQAGIPDFAFANIIDDSDLFAITLEDANTIVKSSDFESKEMMNRVIKSLDSYHLD